jgi:hypothetical protein
VVDLAIDRLNGLHPSEPPLAFPATSQVDGELQELRCHYGPVLYRVLYQRSRNLFVLLHMLRKNSGKIPQADIELARTRQSRRSGTGIAAGRIASVRLPFVRLPLIGAFRWTRSRQVRSVSRICHEIGVSFVGMTAPPTTLGQPPNDRARQSRRMRGLWPRRSK